MNLPNIFRKLLLRCEVIVSIVVAIAGLNSSAAADPTWPVLTFTPIQTGFYYTVDIQNAADNSGRLFLAQHDGFIRIFKNGALLPTAFLDISTRVVPDVESEQGLLGLAFPPNFATKRYFYVFYNRKTDRATVLSRFRLNATNPDVADSSTEEVLLVIPQAQVNHNGGQIAFGPDGYLYIARGDGGGFGDPNRTSQKLTTLLGKLLRIDVENAPAGTPYLIPPSNPFASSGTNRKEILCWGLRNPWRFSFDPATGDLYIGDVGEAQREEVNFIPAAELNQGSNFGWSVKEGTLDFQAQTGVTGILKPPSFEYDHTLGVSVIGGHVYRGANARLRGLYFFGDFQTGRIWAMQPPTAGGQTKMLSDTAYYISTFGKDEAGEIYFANYLGTIYRMNAMDAVPAPTITPVSGTYVDGTMVGIYASLPGTTLRFTTDGTDPNPTSPTIVSGAQFPLSQPATVKAIAERSDLNTSPVARVDLLLRPSPVQFQVPGGIYNNYTTVRLSTTTAGAEIRYTLDQSTPTESSAVYSEQNPIFLTNSRTVKATAFKAGWPASQVSQQTYTLQAAPAAPFTPWSDLYEPVDLRSATADAVIHYTTNGSTPTLQSPVWNGPQNLPAGATINTLTEKGELATSASTLKVVRISSQKAKFYKLGGVQDLAGVARLDDNTFYLVGGYEVLKLLNGTLSRVYQGTGFQNFQAIKITPDLNLAVTDVNSRSVNQFLPPTYSSSTNWSTYPVAPGDLVPEANGSFILADPTNHKISRITASATTSTIAGTGQAGGQDGPALQATFNVPSGIARDDAGRIFVAESSGRRVRSIGTDNVVTTIAGTGEQGWLDGSALAARFERPVALVRDRIGNLYVADRLSTTGQIRKICPDGSVTTLRGPVVQASTGNTIFPESLGKIGPRGLDVDQNGILYVIDAPNFSLYKVIQDDWDNDGIPDATELALGAPFVVGVDDRYTDADGDLYSNSAEWIAGTDLLNPNNHPQGSTIRMRDSETISIVLCCEAGVTYQVEYSDDLAFWLPMGSPVVAPLRSLVLQIKYSPLAPRRFYRASPL